MFDVVGGVEEEIYGGIAFESLGQVATIVQNFINKDPQSLLIVGEGQTETYFALMMKFIQKILAINAK